MIINLLFSDLIYNKGDLPLSSLRHVSIEGGAIADTCRVTGPSRFFLRFRLTFSVIDS